MAVHVVIIMGVSGSGKSTIGSGLAHRIGWVFIEGDELHPAENIRKMQRGEPLTDADRSPWLAEVRRRIDVELGAGRSCVVACSALKAAYRERLRSGIEPITRFVHLTGKEETIRDRMQQRRHYFPPDLLRTQFLTLEPPVELGPLVLRAEVERPAGSIVTDIVNWLALDQEP